MNAIELLKSKIAKGEITAGRKASNPVGEGEYQCVVASAEFGDNQTGTAKRAMIKYKVIKNLTDPTDTKSIGGLFNTYISTTDDSFMEQNIATYSQVLGANGIDPEKIYEDVETLVNVVEEIASILSKQSNRSKDIIVNIKRKEQEKKSAKGKAQYWNDILESTWKSEDSAKVDTDTEVKDDDTKSDIGSETVKPWANA